MRRSEPLGTPAVDDDRNQALADPFYSRTQVTSVEPTIRLVAQQSNRFIITSIGDLRMESRNAGITQDQRNSGEFRAGSNHQRGRRVAADHHLEPAILFAGDTTSGLAGGRRGGLAAGALGGVLRSSSASATMPLSDVRSGVQTDASEGSSAATNLGAGLAGLGPGIDGGGALNGFTRSRRAERRRPPATTAPSPSAAAPEPAASAKRRPRRNRAACPRPGTTSA